MGAVPLAMVLDGRATSMTLESGETILSIAVPAIVVAAPVGKSVPVPILDAGVRGRTVPC